ncbi:MAG: SUMF1/EgtB/PvdO family nonheme iron enzyme [Nitrospirae bacterium]|nr:SUMF1/EgtB/PvdO family nonheme iron enzyme [Nitrospirota bacterium]
MKKYALVLSLVLFASCVVLEPAYEKSYEKSAADSGSCGCSSGSLELADDTNNKCIFSETPVFDCKSTCNYNSANCKKTCGPQDISSQCRKDCSRQFNACVMECRYPMVLVKGGCFQMGDQFGDGKRNELPVHKVCLSDFYIGKYLMTQDLWREIMANNPSEFEGDNKPIENVSWDDIQRFLIKLNDMTGKRYRLPTEAQWEFACRDRGKKIKYAGTNDPEELNDYAWLRYNGYEKTHPVGQRRPNELGLYDMTGNVDEWVHDIYAEEGYSRLPENDPVWEGAGNYRVVRGGSFIKYPQDARCTFRDNGASLVSGLRFVGFRLERNNE